jgi:CsoR family transcriptional regulator, copper-sensing transcriptional repressor
MTDAVREPKVEPSARMAVAGSGCCPTDSQRPMMSEELRADVLLRLRKVGGQVSGVARMVEADRYCVDVLQQLSAVQAAVESVSKLVTRNYLERCVTDAINGGDPLIYDELMRVIYRKR